MITRVPHFPLHLSAAILVVAAVAQGQIRIGTVRGFVIDPTGAPLPNVTVALESSITGHGRVTTTGDDGQFVFNNVAFDSYIVRIEAPGFQPYVNNVRISSNIPISIDAGLRLAGAEQSVIVQAERNIVKQELSSSQIDMDATLIRRHPGASKSRQLQTLIRSGPGWSTENNGLLHIRGVDDGILYVVDGVPTVDRLDLVSASPFDTDMIEALNVITGNFPAEFGGRSGAVVLIQPKSGIDTPFNGSVAIGNGTFRERELAYTVGGKVKKNLGFFMANSASGSRRFLDPVDPRNFNNRGGTARFNLRSDWHPTARDFLLFDVSVNGTNFRVPNDLVQELAGQRQRQKLRDNSQSLGWQRIWSSASVTNLAYFRRLSRSRLLGSSFDVPIFAEQDRQHERQGMIANLTHYYRGHTFKTGFEASRVAPREFFTFAVTDEHEAEEREVSEAAQEFNRGNPFVFRARKSGGQASWFVQDNFSPIKHLVVDAGLRFDRSTLPGPAYQFSPRFGAVYYVAATRTAVRGSFNRLYMPPQVENLLLANSDQARRLSPFVQEEGGGGAPLSPERISAYEIGFAQDFSGLFRLDVAQWWRFFSNFDDPNVFFNTTIIFPNSVAKGFARGVDVRVDFPERKGWSGFLSYTNSRILQTGPINGGLFLTEEFIEIQPGTRFIPDQDQRNVGCFGIIYSHRGSGIWGSLSGRHESGVPLEIEEEHLEDLRSAPGSDLVDFARGRVRPWSIFDFSTGIDLFKDERVEISLQLDVQNLANSRFAYNFGNPFEGTHFGHPRLWRGRLKFNFR